MSRFFQILLLGWLLYGDSAQAASTFAIYDDDRNGEGAWKEGIIAFEHFLDWKGVSHARVKPAMINTTPLKGNYRAIYFPGGVPDCYQEDINAAGIRNIKDFIAGGGAYIGMCAGAEFACEKYVWEGHTTVSTLGLFPGKAVGPIDQLAVWPNYAMARLSMNLGDVINKYEPAKEDMLYWGGSVFRPNAGAVFDILATFDGYNSQIAAVKFTYGAGRVLLIAPHPEIEEDSDRDGVNVADELNDNGSDWNFLWSATDWLVNKPSPFWRYGHTPVVTGWKQRFNGKKMAEQGWTHKNER